LARIITVFGRELTGIAYLVLQHHDDAADAVARGIADISQRVDDPAVAHDLELLRIALLGATAREALQGHAASRTVDPTMDGPGNPVIGLAPSARAVFALEYVAGLEEGVVASLLELSPRNRRRLPEPAVFLARLPAAMAQLAGLPVTVDSDRVRAVFARPDDRVPSRRRWILGAAIPLAVVLLWLALVPRDASPAGGVPPSPSGGRVVGGAVTNATASDLGSDSLWSQFWPGRTAVPPFTLADCDIEPVSSEIAFAGWVTVEQIRATGLAPPGRSVYAIVTRGEAEWIGYRSTHDRPVFPRPVGRLGCVFEPGSGSHVAIGVAQQWEPPTLADGCPASPISSFAGYRELGGPGAFVLVDTGNAWWADDPELSFLVRVAPAPPAGASVAAWLQPVGEGTRVTAGVDAPQADGDGSLVQYMVVDGVEIPEPGCWIMNIAVDGTVVGSATLPIVARAPPAP